MDLNAALNQFDIVEANIVKLEAVWARILALDPGGLVFFGESPEAREQRQLCRDFEHILGGLPAIDGWRITSIPDELDAMAQMRLDAREIQEPEAEISTERHIAEPGRQIDEYRARFRRKRRELVRARTSELIATVDALLDQLMLPTMDRADRSSVEGPKWEQLRQNVSEIDRLVGAGSRNQAWGDLRRHLAFAMVVDLLDIIERDWPAVKQEIAILAYDASEPLPISIGDLGALVAARPAGVVATRLAWSELSDEDFERLIFTIISEASGYENPEWLMRTRAPDRGRDLSVQRVRQDSIAGVERERVIIQCKHWLTRSIADGDVTEVLGKMPHWEPPPVDTLVIATSGRFTADAVSIVERHNHDRKRPKIEMWPESRLEAQLAQRPHVVAEFKLR